MDNADKITLEYGNWATTDSERKAEMSMAKWFIEHFDHDIIEIGEVCPFQINDVKHTVYDYGPQQGATIKMDASDIDYSGKNVLSISTIEHVGNGDYGYSKEDSKAINLLKKMITESKNYLITFPVGYNKDFEKEIVESGIEYILLERSEHNAWKQVEHKDFSHYEYNSPYYAGNALCVFTNLIKRFEFT